MAIILTLKGGEQDFELIWDSTADVPTGVLPSSMTEEAQPIPLWHRAAGEEGNELVEMDYDDARWPLVVMMGPAADWEALLRELAVLRRICRQAHAYALGETWADEVYVEATPDDGSASNTYFTVKLVEDRSGGFLAGTQVPNVILEGIAVTLTVGIGYGDEETLDNEIRNGHMLIESATAGLAQGLTLIGAPTQTLDTAIKLIGAQAQKLVINSGVSDGVYASLTAGAGTTAAGFAWVYSTGDMPGSDGDNITIELQTGAGASIQAKVLEPGDASGVSDRSYTDSGDRTWYRVSVTGSNGGAANFRLAVYRASGDAASITWMWTDGMYLETGKSTTPSAWSDYPSYHNRNDPTATNPERMNRFDVWGIPGDRPAWIRFNIEGDSPTGVDRIVQYWVANNLLTEGADDHILEGEDWTGGGDIVDANCCGGYYNRFQTAAPYWEIDSGKYDGIWHVIGRLRVTDYGNRCRLYREMGEGNVYNEWVTFATANRWQFHSMGLIDLRTSDFFQLLVPSVREIKLGIDGDITGGSGYIHCDYILLLPASEGRLIIGQPTTGWDIGASDTVNFVGWEKLTYFYLGPAARGAASTRWLGGLWTMEPMRMNRLIVAIAHDVTSTTGDEDECLIQYDGAIHFHYRPRTRGFLV